MECKLFVFSSERRCGRRVKMLDDKYARKLWENMLIHDDGICGVGGQFCNLIGAFGHGKSTLLMQAAQFVRNLPYGETKIELRNGDPLSARDVKMYPETVFLRGMSDDHWNTLMQRNWARSYPKYGKSKPLTVHVFENDEYNFYEVSQGKRHKLNHDLNIKKYSSPADLLNNIRIGGINVIYEPSEYYLAPEMLKRLAQYKLQPTEDIKQGVLAPPAAWWFELCDELLTETEGRHVTIILDELHSVTPAYPSGDLFHVIGNFAKSLIHFRKNNISVFGSTHDENLLDYRVKERLPLRIWFPGSLPKNSMVQIKLLRSLNDIGQCVIEEKNISFGVLEFDRIPNQPPILKAQLKT